MITISSPPDRVSADWAIPACSITAFRPRQSRYAVCLFVLNEGERFLAQLQRMRLFSDDFDLLVADGGSTDGSMAAERLERLGVHTLLVKTGPGRLSAQMRMGLAHALTCGYEGVIVMDGNNKDDPEAIPRFATALDDGFEFVQGSRFLPGGRAVNTPLTRYLGIKLVHAPLISLAAGLRYTDTTNGFRAYSRRFLLDPRVQPFREVFANYELHYYLSIRAARLGYRIKEVPVTRSYPARGAVPSKIHGFRGNWNVFKTLLAACAGRWDPSSTSTPRGGPGDA